MPLLVADTAMNDGAGAKLKRHTGNWRGLIL